MNNVLSRYRLLSVLLVAICTFTFCSCGDNDDDDGGIIGMWVPVDGIQQQMQTFSDMWPDLWDTKEEQFSAVSFNFINSNTVEIFDAVVYNYSRHDAFLKGNVQGHEYSMVKGNPVVYTYAIKGNKFYITDGKIGTISDGFIFIDGWDNKFYKIKNK